MEDSGSQIIEQLRQKVQQQALRKSQKLKAQLAAEQQNKSTITNNKANQKNIFANLQKPQSTNLFGVERKSVNLFQVSSKTTVGNSQNGAQDFKNIFNTEQKPLIAKNESQNDSSSKKSSNQPQIGDVREMSQNLFKTQPDEKVMKYEYKNQLIKVLQMTIRKFKNGTALPKEEVYITLQKLENQPSTLYLIIRSSATKVLVYQGIMMKNISKLEHFMNKLDSLRFNVMKKIASSTTQNNQESNSKKKMVKQIVKLQFNTQEQCEEFQNTVNSYFSPSNQ